MGNTNQSEGTGVPENATPTRSMSFGSSKIDKNLPGKPSNSDAVKEFRYVPVEMQDAILELLETCKE
jgi:hypothetical protein